MNKKTHRPELLAPAGSRSGFLAAMQAGADAVYLGGEKFGARAYADNFSQEDLIRTVREAHILGKRVYLTVNILMRESELPELVGYMRPVCAAGLDGVIVQDLGVIRLFSELFPDLELHASTQLSVTAPESVRFLKRLGVCRVVPARELSLTEIENLKKEDIEVEAFVHGAMCYSYSGRCLMSSFLGGRSGNRGRCAGTCRLPYTVLDEHQKPAGKDANRGEYYPISMRDMCALELLPELIDAGIDSFKIEGRMKKPEYAAGVTAVYRKYMDLFGQWDREGRPTPWSIAPEDMDLLKKLYLRTDLCSGYYHERNGRDMVTIRKPGYSGTDEHLLEAIRRTYPPELPKVPVSGTVYLHTGEPSRLVVSASAHGRVQTVSVKGSPVEEARNQPMPEQEILKRLRKTGESPFTFSSLDADLSGSVFIPVSRLNALRRQALEGLETQIITAYDENNLEMIRRKRASLDEGEGGETGHLNFPEGRGNGTALMALVMDREQLQAAVSEGISQIILEFDTEISQDQIEKIAENYCIYLALPYIFRSEERNRILKQIRTQCDGKPLFHGVLVRTIEELELIHSFREQEDISVEILADASIYQWNRTSHALIRLCSDRWVAPLELAGKEISRLEETANPERERWIMPVYGKIPLMISANCVRKTEGLCLQLQKQGRQKKDNHATIDIGEPDYRRTKRAKSLQDAHNEGRFWYLKDRMKKMFPVRCVCSGCHNIIYNAEPLSLHRYLQDVPIAGAGSALLAFTDETGQETAAILHYFRRCLDLNTQDMSSGAVLRMQGQHTGRNGSSGEKERPFDHFTNGHYRRGAI